VDTFHVLWAQWINAVSCLSVIGRIASNLSAMRYLWSSCCIAAKFDSLWCLISAKSRSYCRQSAARYEANVCMLQFAKLTNTVGSRQSGIVWLFCSSYFTNSAFLPILTSCLLLRPCWASKYCDDRVWPSVCLCLSASISLELNVRSSPNFCACYLWPMAQSSSGGVVIRYVLPVLWMASCLYIMPVGHAIVTE